MFYFPFLHIPFSTKPLFVRPSLLPPTITPSSFLHLPLFLLFPLFSNNPAPPVSIWYILWNKLTHIEVTFWLTKCRLSLKHDNTRNHYEFSKRCSPSLEGEFEKVVRVVYFVYLNNSCANYHKYSRWNVGLNDVIANLPLQFNLKLALFFKLYMFIWAQAFVCVL